MIYNDDMEKVNKKECAIEFNRVDTQVLSGKATETALWNCGGYPGTVIRLWCCRNKA